MNEKNVSYFLPQDIWQYQSQIKAYILIFQIQLIRYIDVYIGPV